VVYGWLIGGCGHAWFLFKIPCHPSSLFYHTGAKKLETKESF
jgi:hypothetical protein